jgi:hypothetical protein
MIAVVGSGNVGMIGRISDMMINETSVVKNIGVIVIDSIDSTSNSNWPNRNFSDIKLSDYFQIPIIDPDNEIRSRSAKQKSKLRNRRRSFYSKENIYEG